MQSIITEQDANLLRENIALKQELRRLQGRVSSAEATAAAYRKVAKSYRRRNMERYDRGIERREQRRDIATDIALAIACGGLLWLLCAAIAIIFKAIALA